MERTRARKEEVSLDRESKRKSNNTSKGKNSFGGGFGKSDKGAGTNNSVTCFNCGKLGHKADNCWQPKQVRSLEQDNALSVGAGSNQQGASSANGSMYAASSNATYVNQQAQLSSASSSQKVRRIAIGEDSDVFLFDIGTVQM